MGKNKGKGIALDIYEQAESDLRKLFDAINQMEREQDGDEKIKALEDVIFYSKSLKLDCENQALKNDNEFKNDTEFHDALFAAKKWLVDISEPSNKNFPLYVKAHNNIMKDPHISKKILETNGIEYDSIKAPNKVEDKSVLSEDIAVALMGEQFDLNKSEVDYDAFIEEQQVILNSIKSQNNEAKAVGPSNDIEYSSNEDECETVDEEVLEAIALSLEGDEPEYMDWLAKRFHTSVEEQKEILDSYERKKEEQKAVQHSNDSGSNSVSAEKKNQIVEDIKYTLGQQQAALNSCLNHKGFVNKSNDDTAYKDSPNKKEKIVVANEQLNKEQLMLISTTPINL